MLNKKTITESYTITGGSVYAIYVETGEKRAVNGCSVRAELAVELEEKQRLKAEYELKIKGIDKELYALMKLDNDLAAAGYCKLDKPVYKKVEGLVVKDDNGQPIVERTTHTDYCTNKGA